MIRCPPRPFGCGEPIAERDDYRCLDCGLRMHKQCLRRHCAASDEKDKRIAELEGRDMNLDERNAGAIGMALQLLNDDGRGIMGPGPCGEAQAEWRRMKAAIATSAVSNAGAHGTEEG